MTWEEFSIALGRPGTAGTGINIDPNSEVPIEILQEAGMLAQDGGDYVDETGAAYDPGFWDYGDPSVDAQGTPAPDADYWAAYYQDLALPQPYELPLAITPEAAMADAEATLQQAIQDAGLMGQPMTDAEMQAFISSQSTQIIASQPGADSSMWQKLKDFGSGLAFGGGSGGGAGGGGSIPKAQLPVAATPGISTAGLDGSSTMLLFGGLAVLALFAFSSGRGR